MEVNKTHCYFVSEKLIRIAQSIQLDENLTSMEQKCVDPGRKAWRFLQQVWTPEYSARKLEAIFLPFGSEF